MKAAAVALGLAAALLVAACEREARQFQATAASTTLAAEDNAYALAEGRRLYAWYNCNGCHANGGGDKGPALMDDVWIYPRSIYETIVEGRPNGMPAFGGRISDEQVWQRVAYVRSMSGLASQQAAPNRPDAMHAKKPESQVERASPVNVSTPRP